MNHDWNMKKTKIVEAFQKSIVRLHRQARKYHLRKTKNKNANIKYGRSPSLANYFEEEFVNKLSKIYKNHRFFIDYPFRLYDKQGTSLCSQNIYPDIIVTDMENTLKAIIELKTDIGHLDIKKLTKSKRENILLKAVYGEVNNVVGRYSDQKYKIEKIRIKFPKKYKKILIVITLVNQHSYGGNPKSEEYKRILKKLGYNPLFLLKNIHYNYYDDKTNEIKEEINSNKKEIVRAFKGL